MHTVTRAHARTDKNTPPPPKKKKKKLHLPGLVGLPFLLSVKDELGLTEALREVNVLAVVESFHHRSHELLRRLGLLQLVEKARHVAGEEVAAAGDVEANVVF